MLIPLSPQAKMKNESDRARFLYIGTWTSTCWMEMCIDTKKRIAPATSSFWVALDARGRVWAFEVGERSEVGALESLSPQKNIKINNFNNFKPTTFRSRSAIEAHRTRLASWKRSMPPLSPQIANLRGPRTLESYGKADRSTEGR